QLYAFNYLKYSGETWGENIEGSWAEQNQTAGSTKEQNDSHRHDTLDNFLAFGTAESLFKSYKKCIETLVARETAFTALCSIQPPKLIALWESMDDVPKTLNGKVHSVYEAQFQAVPPTQFQAYQSLVDAERIYSLSGGTWDKSAMGNAQLINIAINIKEEQHRVQHLSLLNKDLDSLIDACAKLQKKMLGWKRSFYTRFSHLDHNATTTHLPPEQEPLMLPSLLNEYTRQVHGLQVLANIELTLRKGQAYDTLNKL
ncbi:hypothetical protein AX14_004035, partial [Amanita brunnescens Koide BX004]